MKLLVPDSHLVNDIRGQKTFRVPKNLILMILIYFGIFFVLQIFESFGMVFGIMPSVFAWANEQMSNSGALNSQEVMDKINSLLEDPSNTFLMLLCTGIATIGAMLYCRVVEGRKVRTMGFYKKGALVSYLLGLVAGFAAFSMLVGIAYLMGGVKFEGWRGQFTGQFFLILLGFGIQGMSEETICRGFMMTSTLRHKNFWIASLVNALIFALAHAINPGFTLLAMVNLTLCGLLFSAYVLRTGNIWGACAFHSIWNFAQGNIYGLPVSGLDTGDTAISMSLTGSDFVNGGAFGLEASIGCTIVQIVFILIFLFVPNPFAKKPETPAQEVSA